MKTHRFYVLLIAGLALLAAAGYSQSREFNKTYQVSKGGNIRIDISAGNVSVLTWKKDACNITIEDVDKYDLDNLSFTQTGNELVFTTTGNIRYLNNVKVSVPESFNVDINTRAGNIGITDNLDGNASLKTAGGNIYSKNITGKLSVKTAGGNIYIGNVDKEVTLKTSGGNIETGYLGGPATISTAGGNIEILLAKDNLTVSTSGGNIEIKESQGELTATTAGGNIGIEKITGTTKLTTSGGDIEVKSAGGDLTAKTSAGSIEAKNVAKSFNASTSAGDIRCHIKQGLKGDISLDTRMGSVYLILPSGVNATVEAAVRGIIAWGDVNAQEYIFSDFTPSKGPDFKGKKEVSAAYVINGGNNKINILATMGSVNIRKGK